MINKEFDKVNLDVLADQAYSLVTYRDEPSSETLRDAETKTNNLYHIIKRGISPELQGVLLAYDDSMGDCMVIIAKESFIQGYKAAFKEQIGVQH